MAVGTDPRSWHPEARYLLAVALLATVLLANGSVDIAVARWFYRAGPADHWPLARLPPWRQLYGAATWITASLVIIGLAGLATSLRRARSHWRRPAILLLLAVAIGPGLLGNALLKDHWRHPRPRDLVEFGGTLHYVPAPLIGTENGAAFPCGHCTVGFLYGAGWWIWKRRRPALAAGCLATGLTLGVLLGVGRMAAGAHFLSDVVWSALLAFAVVHVLHYHVLSPGGALRRVVTGTRAARHLPQLAGIAAPLAGIAVLVALFATPHGTQLRERIPLSAQSPRILQVQADSATIAVVLVDAPASALVIDGELHGFGMPTSRLAAHLDVALHPEPTLIYRIEARGWLTDIDGFVTLTVPASAFDRVGVVVQRGDIRLSDRTAAQVVRSHLLHLELRTAHGRVR
jgi:membrane-associated PAP2 superfamily phosphatase